MERANRHEAYLSEENPSGTEVTEAQLAQAAFLEDATLPNRTIHRSQAKPPAELKVQDAEEQPALPGDLDADANDQELAE